MIRFPDINPVAFQIGPIAFYWYGVAYVIGIMFGMSYAKYLSKKYNLNITCKLLDDYLVYLIIGVILGGRIGYIIIYDPSRYIEIFVIRNGGMSFHGGVVGVGLLSYVFCQKNKISFISLTDIVSIVAPIAIFFGRIANFINGELYGRITSVPWGVVFPNDVQHTRHASQIYEAFFEGIVLLGIMYFTSSKIKQVGYSTGIFLVFYHIFRIFCEFFREPDIHIGFIISTISMGQLLSVPFLILGLYLCRLNQK
jgi:phosphatidylglycerol:prolipoprotein diacylglycerol transferase